MSRFEPIGFVVTLDDVAPQIAAPTPDANATVGWVGRGGTCPYGFARRPLLADEDMPTVRLPRFDFAHSPTVLQGGWSRPR